MNRVPLRRHCSGASRAGLSRGRRLAAAVCVGALAMTTAVVVAAPAASAAPYFYQPPRKLPGANGTIVRSMPITLGVSVQLPGMTGPLPASRATLLMYKSTDSNGRPVAVTGTYLEPSAAWTGGGARPLVSYAEGTQGQGDQCAPSRTLQSPLVVAGSSIALGYEIPSIYALLSKGVAVVVTDYVGLGTTDRLHTYVNRLDQGRAVLDAARAAKNLPGTSLTAASKVAAYGYSQGGGAAASAAELAASYAPEIPLVGTYAGAPPADLGATLAGIDGTALVSAIGWAVNGFVQAYPQLQATLDANVNAAGRAALENLKTSCTGDGLLTYAFQRTTSWTNSGQSLSAVIAADPTAKAILDQQLIGTVRPSAPVRVVSGTQDDFVPHAQVKTLASSWCGKGASVTYAPIIQLLPSGGTGLNHLTPDVTDMSDAQAWVLDRFAGRPATSNCALLPLLP